MLSRRNLLAAAAAPLLARTGKRPNVLFIAADDMNTALGCYGHPVVKTPNIDKLAARGVRFDRAYCQFPLCGPSRASLLTGLRPDVTKVLGNNVDFRDALPDAVTLPQLFKNNGWRSMREGKMFHMNVPTEVTLPRFQDERSWHHSSSPGGPENKSSGELKRTTNETNFGMQWIALTDGKAADGKGQSDSNAAERALGLLEQHRNEPFFLGLGFLRPHLPFVAPGRFYDQYPLDKIPLPINPPGDLDDIPAAAKAVRPVIWNHMRMNEQGIREARRGYYASTSFMDEQVGRVLDGVRQMGLADNTIVVFWGDHGWSLGEHTHWQKMSLMEEVARVPLIVAQPGRAGNGKSARALVEFVDLYPTLADLCGLTAPANVAGKSLRPLLDRPNQKFKSVARTQILFEDVSGRSIRTERFRYTKWEGKGGGEELYDHDKDPGEFRNLASDPAFAKQLREHRALL